MTRMKEWKDKNDLVNIHLYVERTFRDVFKKEAERRGITMTDLVREILNEYAERNGLLKQQSRSKGWGERWGTSPQSGQ